MTTKQSKNPQDLFKPTRKGDRIACVYLYADGHAIARFERYMRDVDKTVTYQKQIDSIGITCRFEGRIVFSSYGGRPWLQAMMAAGCTTIRAKAATTGAGTDITKQRGIPVGYVTAETKFGDVDVYSFPTLMSGSLTYQPDVVEAFEADASKYKAAGDIVETIITKPVADVAS